MKSLPILARMLRVGIVAASAGCLSFPAQGALPSPPPAEAFASLPQARNAQISPDGRFLAWEERDDNDVRIAVFDLAARDFKRHFAVDPRTRLNAIYWSDSETLLIEIRQYVADAYYTGNREPGVDLFRTLAANVTSGKTRILLNTEGERRWITGANVIAWRTSNPGSVVMATLDYPPGRKELAYSLFRVDTRSGKVDRMADGTPSTRDWVANADGDCVARGEWDSRLGEYRMLAKRGTGWTEIYSQTGRGPLAVRGLTADGTSIAAVGPNAGGRSVLWAIPLDGTAARILFEDSDNDVEDVIQDNLTGSAVAVSLGGRDEEIRWIEKKAQARAEILGRAFKGRRVALAESSADGHLVLAGVADPSRPTVYYLVDLEAHRADIAAEEYPALAEVPLGDVRSITYAARDGTSIPAYLTVPPGLEAKSLPLVVVPHGGPELRDRHGFDWLSQFLATRGYAVLRPEFRGSTGFGQPFRNAGRGQWGLRMQDDVTDGVRAMIDRGVADPHRICIVGADYGGYVALAGAAFTPELYKCAVSIAGVADLPVMLGATLMPIRPEASEAISMRESISLMSGKDRVARSPARAADRIRIPILLMHQFDDPVVPVEQSDRMARALDRAHKKYSFVKLPGEDHWMARAQTRLRVLQEVERFLGENL